MRDFFLRLFAGDYFKMELLKVGLIFLFGFFAGAISLSIQHSATPPRIKGKISAEFKTKIHSLKPESTIILTCKQEYITLKTN
jgi:hypothetical protein